MLAHTVSNLVELFEARVAQSGDEEVWRVKQQGVWVPSTWNQLSVRVDAVAAGLAELGLARGQSVAILGGTNPEWVVCDLAALSLGASSVGIYETLVRDQIAFILEDSGASVLFVQGAESFARVRPLLDEIAGLEHLVVWDDSPDPEAGVLTLEDLAERGKVALAANPDVLVSRRRAVSADDLALIVYTSGTTGRPKGVPLRHGQIVGWMAATQDMLAEPMTADDVTISFLPMAHVAEHVPGLFGRMNVGLRTAYATNYDTLLDELLEIRPTYFGAVPRIFEKMYGRILERVAQANPRRQAIFQWAADLARRRADAVAMGGEIGTRDQFLESLPGPLGVLGPDGAPSLSLKDRAMFRLADRLVFRRIREVFGGRVKWFITGSAPLDLDINRFFWGAGMRILEVYGLSEACGISFANTVSDFRLGTVGRVVPGVECKQGDDGEILLRGGPVFEGYLNLEGDNAEVFDEEGFLRTGDIGEIDADGYLRITDRKKNLIKTAGGKYVVPARLQTFVKAEPVVGSVYIHGDLKPFVVALITIDERELAQLAEELRVDEADVPTHPDVVARIDTAVKRANQNLAPFEQIKRHALLPEDFSIEADTLTPTMKIKRRVVAQAYAEVIDNLYAEATEAHRQARA